MQVSFEDLFKLVWGVVSAALFFYLARVHNHRAKVSDNIDKIHDRITKLESTQITEDRVEKSIENYMRLNTAILERVEKAMLAMERETSSINLRVSEMNGRVKAIEAQHDKH